MPIHVRENQYRGVNAHLHSFLQNEPGGWWEVFHAEYIALLRTAIDDLLPTGYYVLSEKSLQMSGEDLTPSILETRSAEDELQSVVIYHLEEEHELIPVTRIELLSPSNKPPASDYHRYLEKRTELLERAIHLIEIDYLHQTRSPVTLVPVYGGKEINAFPYNILVNHVRESLEASTTVVYRVAVDQPLPKIAIPLLSEEAIIFDFEAVYHETYSKQRFYGEVVVDYEALPMNFESYSEDDQARIRQVMERVKAKLVPPPPPA